MRNPLPLFSLFRLFCIGCFLGLSPDSYRDVIRTTWLFFLAFAFLLLCPFAFAQQNKIDSLKKLLAIAKEDTSKVNVLNTLAWELSTRNPDTSILLSKQALSLAEKNNWEIRIGRSEHCLGRFAELKGEYDFSLEHYFKALKIWENLERQKFPKNFRDYVLNLKSKTIGNIGIVYRNQADYPKALDYYFKALKMKEELGEKNGIAINFGNIGLVYDNQGNYPKAIDYYLKALKIAEELENKQLQANNLGNIGNVYAIQADYPKALDYYFKALGIAEELGNKNSIAAWLGNIGRVFFMQGKNHNSQIARDSLFNKALDYYLKALKMKEELEDKNGIALWLGNIGNVYNDQAAFSFVVSAKGKLFTKALDYYFRALKIDEYLENEQGVAMHLANIGSVYIQIGKVAEAEKYLKRSLAIADSIGWLEGTKGNHQSLSHLYDTTSRHKLALEHYKKYITARDSIANEENTKKQTRLEMQYEFDKREAKAKAEAEVKEAKAKAEAKKQQLVLIGVISGLLLVVAFAGFIFRAYRQIKQKNLLIEEQKKKISEKHEDLLASLRYGAYLQGRVLPSMKYIHESFEKLKQKKPHPDNYRDRD